MKKVTASGVLLLLTGEYYALLSATCQMVGSRTIECSMSISQISINLDIGDRPIDSLLYGYEEMIIANNEHREIAYNGNEPGGFQDIGGPRAGPVGNDKPGDIYSIDHLPGIGYSFQVGEQDDVNFDLLFTVWPSAPVLSDQHTFQAENKEPVVCFWRIADNGSLPPPGEYCLDDYLGDTYPGGVQAMRFGVGGFCTQVKSSTCKITDDSKNISVFLGRHNRTTFTGPNSTTTPVPFNVSLTSYENVGSVFMQFSATVDSIAAANEVAKIGGQSEDTSGLGAQILSADSTLMPLNRVSRVWSRNRGSRMNYRPSCQARYIRVQPAVTADGANANATFVVIYN